MEQPSCVFTSDGQFVMTFGKERESSKKYKHVGGLAVDNCGVVYVCDHDGNHIHLF